MDNLSLDLDALLETKTFTYRGKTYEVDDIPIEAYAQFTTALRDLGDLPDAGNAEDVEKHLEHQQRRLRILKAIVGAVVPDMPKEDFDRMGSKRLMALANFIIDAVTVRSGDQDANSTEDTADPTETAAKGSKKGGAKSKG